MPVRVLTTQVLVLVHLELPVMVQLPVRVILRADLAEVKRVVLGLLYSMLHS